MAVKRWAAGLAILTVVLGPSLTRAQTPVPIPPMPVLLASCVRDEQRGVAVSFVDVDTVAVAKVTVDFLAPDGRMQRTEAIGDFQPQAPASVYLSPNMDALLPDARVSPKAVRCRIDGLAYADGTAWTRAGAVNVPTPLPSGAVPPVAVSACAYDPAAQRVSIAYRNAAARPLTHARVRLSWANRMVYVLLDGTVPPGGTASRTVELPLGNAKSPVPPTGLTCSLATAEFAGLPTWSDADLSNTATVLFPPLGNGIRVASCSVDDGKVFHALVRNVTLEHIASTIVRVTWTPTGNLGDATPSPKSTTFEVDDLGPRGLRRYDNEDLGQALATAQAVPSCAVNSVVYSDGERWPATQ